MFNFRKYGIWLAVAGAAFVAAHSSADAQDDADREAILAIMRDGPVAIGPGTDTWESNFHPDWTVWFLGQAEARQREPHMANVRAYVDSGADVIAYDFDLVGLDVIGATAIVRYNAVEHIVEGDGGQRDVAYSGADILVREDGRWLILSSSIAFPERYAED